MMDGMNQAVRENLVASRVVKAFVRGGYESKRFDKTTDDLRQATSWAQGDCLPCPAPLPWALCGRAAC